MSVFGFCIWNKVRFHRLSSCVAMFLLLLLLCYVSFWFCLWCCCIVYSNFTYAERVVYISFLCARIMLHIYVALYRRDGSTKSKASEKKQSIDGEMKFEHFEIKKKRKMRKREKERSICLFFHHWSKVTWTCTAYVQQYYTILKSIFVLIFIKIAFYDSLRQ